jgi:hypothetical protein
MQGYWYSVRENFEMSRKEWTEIFWTSLIFGFILSFRKWGEGDTVNVASGIGNWILAKIFVVITMLIHVSCQKLVAIRLGYKATYSYWLNGLLLCTLLGFMSFGYIMLILPGAVMIEHIPKLRLGKFRYGTNLKDIARVALAGPISHVLAVMIIGVFYFSSGRPEILMDLMFLNLLLGVYSMLPIPKIDVPTKMDAGSDGLAMFYFSRTLYVLVFATILIYTGLILVATTYASLWWLFILAFFIGSALAFLYSLSVEQRN